MKNKDYCPAFKKTQAIKATITFLLSMKYYVGECVEQIEGFDNYLLIQTKYCFMYFNLDN